MTDLEQIEAQIETLKALVAGEAEEALAAAEDAGETALEAVHPGMSSVPLIEELSSAGFPWGSQWPFGLAAATAGVIVYPGVIRVGVKLYESAETELTFTSAGTWAVFWNFDHSTQALTVREVENEEASWDGIEIDEAGYTSGLLYEFTVTDPGGGAALQVAISKIWGMGLAYPQVWGEVH